MTRTTMSMIFALVFASLLVISNVQAGGKCTEATLEGSYGHIITGTRFDLDRALAVNVGIVVFDGRGNYTLSITTTVNGEVQRSTGSGSYTLNENCSGTTYGADGTPLFDIVLVDGGREILYINILGDRSNNGVGKKQ